MKNKGIICLCGVIAAIAAYVIITDDAPSRNKTPEFPEKSSIFSIPFENSPTESTSPLAESSIISYPKPPEESNRQYSQWYDQTSKSSEVVSYWQEESNEPESVFYTQGIYKNNPKGYPDNFMKSSAKTLEGRTIIISVFANDDHTAWTMDDRDNDIRYEMMKNMEIACNWLEEQSRSYGKDAELIFSFDGTTGLAYTAQFYEDATSQMTGELYSSESSFAENYIDTAGLVQKYQADNVIYMYFFDTPYSGTARPFTLSHTSANYCHYECVTMYTRFNDVISPPSTMAHEMLHCFGAYDLYYASEIPQEYVDYCEEMGSNDIMFTVNLGDEITSDMTELAAYYVGLTDYCSTVSEWSLPIAERFT